MTDRVLAGRYRLVKLIGRGGMGVVWRARDETLNRDVAVKEVLLLDDLPESERASLRERAIREARAAALLDHPGIITVHDVVTENDRPWIVMELIAGRSLDRAGPLPPRTVATIGLRVLEALREAHGRGILHRDVKPTNILLADDGRVILTDFGIASLDGDPSLTRTGSFVGSPGFVAPERLRERSVGPASDLWSLGATLYTAVEGRPPFARDTPVAALGAVITDEAPAPVRAGPLAPVLFHMLVKDPDARISADDAARALGHVERGAWSGLRVPEPKPAPTGGRRVLPVAAVVVALLVVAAGIVAFRLRGGDEKPSPAAHATPTTNAPTASPTTANSARYVKPFDFCTLLTLDQVHQLVPGAKRFKDSDASSCGWGAPARHQAISISVESVYDPATGDRPDDPWTATPTEARGTFKEDRSADRKTSDDEAWGWDELNIRRTNAHRSAARDVSGIGEGAYTTETSSNGVVERADVSFYDSNVMLTIWYVAAGGSADAAHIRQNALTTARWAAQALRKQS